MPYLDGNEVGCNNIPEPLEKRYIFSYIIELMFKVYKIYLMNKMIKYLIFHNSFRSNLVVNSLYRFLTVTSVTVAASAISL